MLVRNCSPIFLFRFSLMYMFAARCDYSSYSKLIFGSGTNVKVNPGDNVNVKSETKRDIPSVYKLKSSKSVENMPNSVCLITDFPNPNKTLQVDGKDVNLNDLAVLDKSLDDKWRYSTVTWDNSKDVSCDGKYGDKDLSTESETENTDGTCSSISINESFRTNPSLNTLSLTVLGLRVLTVKAIIFNLIITLRLWSS